MKYGLSEKQFDEAIKVISGFKEIEEAVLFGSRALGSFKEASDIDIALKGSKADHNTASSLKSRFEDETGLPFFFDVVSYSDIVHPKLKEHIDRYGTTVYRKNWRTVKLGDATIINPLESIPKKSNGKKVLMDDLVPFQRKISGFKHAIYKGGSKFRNGDILLARITPCLENGKTAYVDVLEKNEVGFGSTEFIVIRKKRHFTDSLFLFYLAVSPYFRDSAVKSMTGSSGRQRVQIDELKNLQFLLPPLQEQKSIAEVLSGLDDKIDLLHRQNKTLEDTAQALFRQWFIKESRPDWETVPLDEIAHYLNGLACQKHPPKNEIDKLPVLKIKELRNGLAENSDWADSKAENKYIVELGDIIFSWSGSLMIKIWHGPRCVLNQHLFKVTSKNYPKWLYYFWTKHYMEKFISIAESKATTMGHIQRKHLSNAKVLVPSQKDLLKMNNETEPLFERLILNLKSVLELAKLRETLLPKLISGSVRVRQASNER